MSKIYCPKKAKCKPSCTFKRHLLLPIVCVSSVLIIYFSFMLALTNVFYGLSTSQEEYLWDMVGGDITPKEELTMHEKIVQKRVQNLVDKLPNSLKSVKYKTYQVVLMRDPMINAFAAPGGRIIITTGLLNSLKTENGLVFVLGHELGHFMKNDHLNEFARVASAGLFSSTSFSGTSLLFELYLALNNDDSQEREYAADNWGLKTLMSYYGHIGGISDFFTVLKDIEEGPEDLGIFSTHPPTKERARRINDKIAKDRLSSRRATSISRHILGVFK